MATHTVSLVATPCGLSISPHSPAAPVSELATPNAAFSLPNSTHPAWTFTTGTGAANANLLLRERFTTSATPWDLQDFTDVFNNTGCSFSLLKYVYFKAMDATVGVVIQGNPTAATPWAADAITLPAGYEFVIAGQSAAGLAVGSLNEILVTRASGAVEVEYDVVILGVAS